MNRPQLAQEEDSGLVGEGNTARLQNVTVSMRSRSVCPPETGRGPLCPLPTLKAAGPADGAPSGGGGTSVFSKWDKLSPPLTLVAFALG